MHQHSLIVLLVVVAGIAVVSAGHGRKDKMNKKMEFMKNCMKSTGVDEHAKWQTIQEQCRSETMMMADSSATTPQTTDKKKGKNKMAKKCIHACYLKKKLFPDNAVKTDAVQTFSKTLNDAVQDVFVMQVNSCFTSKSVDLNKLSMSTNTTENCQTWEAPVKCFKTALKMACKNSTSTLTASANGKTMDDSMDSEDMEDEMASTTMSS